MRDTIRWLWLWVRFGRQWRRCGCSFCRMRTAEFAYHVKEPLGDFLRRCYAGEFSPRPPQESK